MNQIHLRKIMMDIRFIRGKYYIFTTYIMKEGNWMAKGELALDNKLRKMIYNHITTYPGVSFNILKNVFELSDGALRYHIDYLEMNERISSGAERGIRCYYPHNNVVNVPKKSSDNLRLHKLSQVQERMLETIKHYPGINQKELTHRTRLNRFQIANNIKTLVSMNLVNQYRNSSTICYEYVPDDEQRFTLMKRLVIKLLHNEIDEKTFLELKRKLD